MKVRSRRHFDKICERQDELTEIVDDGGTLTEAQEAELNEIGEAIIAWEQRCEERTGWSYGGE